MDSVTGPVNRFKQLIAGRQGRLTGAVAGLLLGGVAVAVVGFLLGWGADLLRRLWPFAPWRWTRCAPEAQPAVLMSVLFGWLGRLAKADGRVSVAEITAVRDIMTDLRLNTGARRVAIDLFTRGKAPSFPAVLTARLMGRVVAEPDARRAVRLASRVAVADGRPPSRAVRATLDEFAGLLGVSDADVALFLQPEEPSARPQILPARTLSGALGLLGLKQDADGAAIKLAYRRLVSANHPDRVVARGLPDTEVRAAGERTRMIREAYELLRRHGRA